MPYAMGGIENARENLLQSTAAKAAVKSDAGATYSDTIAAVLDKMEKGEDTGSSSAASLIHKITNGRDDKNTLAQVLSSGSNFTGNIAVREKVNQLLEVSEQLLKTKEGSLFIKSRPLSEEAKDAFAITCSGNGTSFTLDVKQLAVEQMNNSKTLPLSAACSLSVGRHYFNITVDGETKALVMKVSAGDTNETVLKNIVNTINNAKLPVKASLNKDEAGNGHICVRCNNTGAPLEGEESVFYFSESAPESIVAQFGLNQITQKGQDAIFNFNNADEDTTYMYNSALIDSVVSVDFKKVTNGPVSVVFDYDYDSLSAKAEQFVKDYNALADAVSDSEYKTIKNYFKQVTDSYGLFEDGLKSIGITKTSGGKLQYNNGMLYATDIGDIKKVLNGQDTLVCKTKEIMSSLSKYMDRLTGKTKKYYGLRAKKSNAHLRAKLNQQVY